MNDGLQTMMTRTARENSGRPCTDCERFDDCADQFLACPAFIEWMNTGKPHAYDPLEPPTHALYLRVWSEDD